MVEPNADEVRSDLHADDPAERIATLAQSLVAMFGDDAPVVVQRQAEAATAQTRRSWAAILMCVNEILARV